MAAFELGSTHHGGGAGDSLPDSNRLREEPIIAHKIYDSCRAQDCLTPSELGPARAKEAAFIDCHSVSPGDVIVPPPDAVSVNVCELKLERISIADKKPSPFKKGFWDVDVKYVFEYDLSFRGADGEVSVEVKAFSIYNKKLTLFGSHGSEHIVGSDLPMFCGGGGCEPFVWVEGKAMELSAEIRHGHCPKGGGHKPLDVGVTIGLFSIVQMFRIVNLRVESRGFDIPRECNDLCPTNPCEFFDALDFPMDIFAPPQLPEFNSGKSSNIPRLTVKTD